MTHTRLPDRPYLSLLSQQSAQVLLAAVAAAAALMTAAEWLAGASNPARLLPGLLLTAGLLALMLAVRGQAISVLRAQRLAAAALGLFLAGHVALQAWHPGPAGVDSMQLARSCAWALALQPLLFMSFERTWATALALGLAAQSLLLMGLFRLPLAPGQGLLLANLTLAQVCLAALLCGVAAQVRRLTDLGRLAHSGEARDFRNVSELVQSGEIALRRLLRKAEQSEQRAVQREAELRTMLDAFPGVVMRVEADGMLSYCNQQAAALLNRHPGQLQGRHATLLMGDEAFARCSQRSLQMAASGEPLSYEAKVERADGTSQDFLMTQFVLAARERATRDGSAGADAGSGRVAWYQIGVDISERKQAEAALSQAKAEAERANRAKSRFMSSMSHELRTPLNAVLGLAQMLRVQAPQLDAQQQLHLDTIADAGKDLLDLVEETMDLSRLDAGDMRVSCQPVNVAELVRAALDAVAPLAAEQGVKLAPPLFLRQLWVQADPVRLRQVLLNLLSNAIKYNRPGGGVAVRLARVGLEAQLVVHDTGVGLTPQQQAQLFQPYNRLGAEHGGVPGTGIGLSIARGLVSLMSGRMDVRSHVGVGTEFLVWLQLAEAPERAPAVAASHSLQALNENPAVRGRLLYVEDNDVNVLVFQACLARRPNVKLQVVRRGDDALALAARESFDLVVLDLNLPDRSGFELAQALRAGPLAPDAGAGAGAACEVPIVLLTADATAQTAQAAPSCGIQQVWTKPFDAARLLGDIDRLLGYSKSPVAQAAAGVL